MRRARANAADALDAADVFLYRDLSVAPLLDMSFTGRWSLLLSGIKFLL